MAGTQRKRILKQYIQQLAFWFALLGAPLTVLSAEQKAVIEPYPDILSMPQYIYEDYVTASDMTFTEEAVPYWWAVGVSTVLLWYTDEQWINESKRLGKKLGINSDDKTETVLKYKDVDLLRLPQDTGSFMYFIGDGWTHASIAAGFLATGAWTEDDKAYNVGFQIIEGMVTTTIATQALKHVTGRESPNQRTSPRGEWDLLPNQRAYFDNVAKYDAFPSGHLAVGTMTLTVISKNYPEKTWIVPTGVTLLSLLSFQMMNNEVHWASDYPLAIALGYTFGTIAYERGKNATGVNTVQWLPIVEPDAVGVGMNYQF
ncbi:MAG: phosphatase PAP2 family protein [Ghiorsea sp.]